MQSALLQAQQQLAEVQQQWTNDGTNYIFCHKEFDGKQFSIVVDTLKDSMAMEALKLTDCENRLKQTELHLQGELNRVRRRISIELYICIGCC